MKKLFLLFSSVLLSIILVGPSQAAFYVYTFQGTISSINLDNGGLIGTNYQVGDSVEYKVAIDFDADGYIKNANLTDPTIQSDTATLDRFYADFISGDIIQGDDNFQGAEVEEYNFGNNYLNADQGAIYVGTYNSYLTIYDLQDVVDWEEGESTFDAYTLGYNTSNEQSKFTIFNMTLTDITPVPVPGAIWLLCSGLLGLAGLKRKLNK